MKAAGNNMMWLIGAMMVALIVFTVVIRSMDFKNRPEAKAFEIANAVAVDITELSAAEEGSINYEFEGEYVVGFGRNSGAWVWLKQAALPEFAEKLFLEKITQQKPQGVYVVVTPVSKKTVGVSATLPGTGQQEKVEEKEPDLKGAQYAYVAGYSLFTGDIKPLLAAVPTGPMTSLCVVKEAGKKLAEVKAC